MTVLVAVTFLLHIFLKHPSSSLDGIRELRSDNYSSIETIKDSIVNNAYTASKEEILTLQNQLKEYRLEEERLDKIYSDKRAKASISGFPSLHKFTWHFGIGLVILSLSIYLLTTVNLFDEERKKAANFASMIAITISGYYMAWIFFPYDDLPYNIYMSLLVGIGVLSAILAYWVSKVNFLTVSKLKSMIRFVMDKVIIDSRTHVKDNDKWVKEIVSPILDKLDE